MQPTQAETDILARQRFSRSAGQMLGMCLKRRFRLGFLRGYQDIVFRWLLSLLISIAMGTLFLQLSVTIEVMQIPDAFHAVIFCDLKALDATLARF